MEFDATKEINRRYEEYLKNSTSTDISVPDFESVPLFGENQDAYMEYIRSNSILNSNPSNVIGRFMRKLNWFWYRPLFTNQDSVNSSIRTALEDLYRANLRKQELINKVSELEARLLELERSEV